MVIKVPEGGASFAFGALFFLDWSLGGDGGLGNIIGIRLVARMLACHQSAKSDVESGVKGGELGSEEECGHVIHGNCPGFF